MVRAVIDTNVIVSGLIKPGVPRKIWLAFKSGGCRFILSPSIFAEIAAVLQRPKFQGLICEEARKELLLYLELNADFVEPENPVIACRDPEDNHILACAEASKAGYIVTGDKDLLILKSFHGIPIITPRTFLAKL